MSSGGLWQLWEQSLPGAESGGWAGPGAPLGEGQQEAPGHVPPWQQHPLPSRPCFQRELPLPGAGAWILRAVDALPRGCLRQELALALLMLRGGIPRSLALLSQENDSVPLFLSCSNGEDPSLLLSRMGRDDRALSVKKGTGNESRKFQLLTACSGNGRTFSPRSQWYLNC